VAKATTVRFTDEMFARLDQAAARTGMPVNSIVVAACLEWMERHGLAATGFTEATTATPLELPRPRWATLRRAVRLAVAERGSSSTYPFERFTSAAQKMLTAAQAEAQLGGYNYIGTEHLMLAAYADPASQAAKILAALDIQQETLRSMVDEVLRGRRTATHQRMVPTARVKKVIELAFSLCGAMGSPRVGTGHVLLALATEGDGLAAQVLREAGASPDRIRESLESLAEPEA
jgi:hypothetical protein